jgi:hypothetical protein
MVFNLYAEIHTQHKRYGLFDKEQMRIWEHRLTSDFQQRPFLRGYWESEKEKYPGEYTKSFKRFVDRALERAEEKEHTPITPPPVSPAKIA